MIVSAFSYTLLLTINRMITVTNINIKYITFRECSPSKQEAFTQGWFDVGPAAATLGQYQTNLG